MIKEYDFNGNIENFLLNIGGYLKKISDTEYIMLSLNEKEKFLIKIIEKNFEENKKWTSYYIKEKINRKKIKELIEANIYNKNDILIFLFKDKIIRVDLRKYKRTLRITNSKVHDMKKSLRIGEVGEDIILKYLSNKKEIQAVKDVRESKLFRRIDIDFLIKYNNEKKESIEVKTDNYKSKNIFYETMSCIETNSLGCIPKSKADYIYYYFIKEDICYILNRVKLVEWFEKNKSRFSKKVFRNKRYDGTVYTSEGYIIPKKFLEENFKYFTKIKISKD